MTFSREGGVAAALEAPRQEFPAHRSRRAVPDLAPDGAPVHRGPAPDGDRRARAVAALQAVQLTPL